MKERIYDTQRAANLLQQLIGDNRNYVQLLQDARRDRRDADILPICCSRTGKCLYLYSDLLKFAEAEVARGKGPESEYLVIEGETRLDIIAKAIALR